MNSVHTIVYRTGRVVGWMENTLQPEFRCTEALQGIDAIDYIACGSSYGYFDYEEEELFVLHTTEYCREDYRYLQIREVTDMKFIYTSSVGKQALSGSIEKWKKIKASYYATDNPDNVDDEYKDDGIRDCALCQVFHVDDCIECPIRLDTGEAFCDGTPYGRYCRWYEEDTEHVSAAEHLADGRRRVDDMLNYLIDLDSRTVEE